MTSSENSNNCETNDNDISKKRFDRTYTMQDNINSDDLNNPESLKEIIIHLSNEYDEFKEKHSLLETTLIGKEKIILDLLENMNTKEEEYHEEVQNLRYQVSTLNEKIQEYEDELYSFRKEEEYRTRARTMTKNRLIRGSIYEKKQDNQQDYDDEITQLRQEISEREIEIETLKIKFDQNLIQNEEKSHTYINELQGEIRKLHDALDSNNENDTLLKRQISQIEDKREMLEKQNLTLKKELLNLENLRKDDKTNYEFEKERLITELNALKKILDERNIMVKNFEELSNKYNNTLHEMNHFMASLATSEQNGQKLTSLVKQLQEEIATKEIEKENLLIEYNELLNSGYKSKDKFHSEEVRIDIIDNEKNELIKEIEKMKKVIENLEVININEKPITSRSEFLSKDKLKFNTTKYNSSFRSNSFDNDNLLENKNPEPNEFSTLGDLLNEEDHRDLLTDYPINLPNIQNVNDKQTNEFQLKIKELSIEVEEKDKNYQKIQNKLGEMSLTIENLISQNLELKTILANERFERENDHSKFNIKMRKLKEYIQKQENALALKPLNGTNGENYFSQKTKK